MAVTRTQAVSANASSVAIASTSSGDLIIVFAYNNGSTTTPTLPSGFTKIDSGTATGEAAIAGYKVSISGGDTSSGTWTNATNVVCHVYRGALAVGTGHAAVQGNSNVLTYPAITLQAGSGNSWIAGFGGAKAATAGMNGSTTSLGNRTFQTTMNGLDSGGPKTAYSAETLTITGSGRYATQVVEIRSAMIAIAGETGTFSLTGNAAGTQELAEADTGPFILTANAALTLELATAASGTFNVTGDAGFLIELVPADTGTFTLTGGNADYTISSGDILIAGGTGAFTLTGNDAQTLELATADTGAFTATGNDANTLELATADSGTFNITGNDGFSAGLAQADPGVFSVTGGNSFLLEVIPGDSGALAVTGGDAQTLSGATADTGVLAVTGSDAETLGAATAATGAFILTGGDADYVISGGSGDIFVAGQTGLFVLVGGDAQTEELAGVSTGGFDLLGGDSYLTEFVAAGSASFLLAGGDADYIVHSGDLFRSGETGLFIVTGGDSLSEISAMWYPFLTKTTPTSWQPGPLGPTSWIRNSVAWILTWLRD